MDPKKALFLQALANAQAASGKGPNRGKVKSGKNVKGKNFKGNGKNSKKPEKEPDKRKK